MANTATLTISPGSPHIPNGDIFANGSSFEIGETMEIVVELEDEYGNLINEFPETGNDRLRLEKTGSGTDASYDVSVNEGAGEYRFNIVATSDMVGDIDFVATDGTNNISNTLTLSVSSAVSLSLSTVTADKTAAKRKESFVGTITLKDSSGTNRDAETGVTPYLIWENIAYATTKIATGIYETTIEIPLKNIDAHVQTHVDEVINLQASYNNTPNETANLTDTHAITVSQKDVEIVDISAMDGLGDVEFNSSYHRPYHIYFANANETAIVIANNIDTYEVVLNEYGHFAIALGVGDNSTTQSTSLDNINGNYDFASSAVVIDWGDGNVSSFSDDAPVNGRYQISHFYDTGGTYTIEIDHEELSLFVTVKVRLVKNERSFLFNQSASDGVIDFGDLTAFNFAKTDTFSVSAFVKLSSLNNTVMLVSKRGTVGADLKGWAFYIANDNTVRFIFNSDSTNRIVVNTGNTVGQNIWYHLVLVYNGNGLASGVDIYIDKVNQSLSTIDNDLGANAVPTGVPLLIGNNDVETQAFEGNLDSIIIWDKGLSQSEINEIYDASKDNDLFNVSCISDAMLIVTGEEDTTATNGVKDRTANSYTGSISGDVVFETSIPT